MKISDERLLELLLSCGGVSGAAKAAGMTERAVYSRLSKAEFRRRYDESRAAILENGVAILGDGVADAAAFLHTVVTDEMSPIALKIQASDAILRHNLRYVELANIQRRVEEVERRLDEAESDGE